MSEHIFFTTAVHLQSWSYQQVKDDPVSMHTQYEAIDKVHRFCHEIYQVPVTWLVSWGALMKYKDKIVPFCRDYQDEIAILEYGIYPSNVLGEKKEEIQGWVEQAGMHRPHSYQGEEEELVSTLSWRDMPYEQQKQGISFLKEQFEAVTGQRIKTFACPFINGDTIRVLTELGFEVIWGYNWNYANEGINNKGCLCYPFYPSDENHNLPSQTAAGPLALHWCMFCMPVNYNLQLVSHRVPAWCLNPMEFANRSMGMDTYDYDRKVIRQWCDQAKNNPFVHLPIQLEALWMDEGEELPEHYDQFPTFNKRCTEVFYRQIEEALRANAVPLTQSQFAAWHRENVGKTAQMLLYFEDVVPQLRGNGKDRAYEPMVFFCNDKKQYLFSKSEGFSYVQRYDYDKTPYDAQICGEYPYSPRPQVGLKTHASVRVAGGIQLDEEGAVYEVSGLEFTAWKDDEDYAALIWEDFVPENIADEELKTENIKVLQTIRDKNALLFTADLKQGENHVRIYSEKPKDYIRIQRVERVGKRVEIWIENTGCSAGLAKLQVKIGTGLRLGGLWWDGSYQRNLFEKDNAMYDRHLGLFTLTAAYPDVYWIREGLTRVSVELK